MKLKQYKYRINGTKFNVGVGEQVGNTIHVEVNGTPYNVEIDQDGAPVQVAKVASAPKAPAAAPRTESGQKVIAKPAASAASGAVKSPLPGTVMSIAVNVGDKVNAGDTVCVLEAMKMENDIHSEISGTVQKILVNVGDAILEGNEIMIIG